jgi:hypothetical protein
LRIRLRVCAPARLGAQDPLKPLCYRCPLDLFGSSVLGCVTLWWVFGAHAAAPWSSSSDESASQALGRAPRGAQAGLQGLLWGSPLAFARASISSASRKGTLVPGQLRKFLCRMPSTSALPARALAKSKPMARRQFEAARLGTLSGQFKKSVARTLPPRALSARPQMARHPGPSVLGKLASLNWRNAAVRRTITCGAVPEKPDAQASGTPVSATTRPPCAETPEKVLWVRL